MTAEKVDVRTIWDGAEIGDELPDRVGPACDATRYDGVWNCSRAGGHATGTQHVATDCGEVVATWTWCVDDPPPAAPAGFRLVDCEVDPPHALYYPTDEPDGGYGHWCPWCGYDAQLPQVEACQHRVWRRWPVSKRLMSRLYGLGVIAGYGVVGGGPGRPPHRGCISSVAWKGRRPYRLGLLDTTWRCLLRGRHVPGETVAFGYCGKCIPWPCCGAETREHADGCQEAS